MPRTIEFEPDVVLESVMLQFWENGYKNTSMRDIMANTGLQPGSLYSTFKNKRTLFLATLERYSKRRLEVISALFGTDEPALQRLQNFFDFIVKSSLSKEGCKGCLMVNTMLENPNNDAEIRRHITKIFQKVEHQIKNVLDEAKSEGAIAKDKDTAALAKLIITTIHGIRALNKTRPSKATLNTIIHSLMLAIQN